MTSQGITEGPVTRTLRSNGRSGCLYRCQSLGCDCPDKLMSLKQQARLRSLRARAKNNLQEKWQEKPSKPRCPAARELVDAAKPGTGCRFSGPNRICACATTCTRHRRTRAGSTGAPGAADPTAAPSGGSDGTFRKRDTSKLLRRRDKLRAFLLS